MAKESVHKKLERVRPPRVHVTYDVEVGDPIEVKGLPFVMGVLADLSGQPTEALPKLKDRRFVEITPDNFDGVLESFKPHLSLEVDNKLSDEADAGKLKVDIDFKSLDDFDPASVAKNVKPLRELLELRQKLGDLRGALQGNDKLDDLLMEAVGNTQKADQLKKELAKDKPKGGSDEKAGEGGRPTRGTQNAGQA